MRVLALLWVCASSAFAQTAVEEADLRTRTAELARDAGRLDDALADLRRAREIDPTPERTWAVAVLLDAMGRAPEAAQQYRDYLGAAPIGAHAAQARARLDAMHAPARAFYEEPWLWVIIGVIAIGAVATGLIVGAQGGTQGPIPGDDGAVVRTLVEFP